MKTTHNECRHCGLQKGTVEDTGVHCANGHEHYWGESNKEKAPLLKTHYNCRHAESNQMCSDCIELFLATQKAELISQIKGLGCNPENDSLTIARILNELR